MGFERVPGGAGAPTGPAGGDLGGTYPDPSVDDGADSTAIHNNVAAEINAIAEKVTPVGTDLIVIEDSAAANAKKKAQLPNLPAGTPAAHAASHSDAGTDEVTVQNLGSTGATANQILEADGAGGLSFVDKADDVIMWAVNGALDITAPDPIDGLRPMRSAGTIIGVIATVAKRGSTGAAASTIVDIHKHVPTKPITTQRNATAGVTIYTTQANRPTLTGDGANPTDNSIIQTAAPDVTAFVAGDFFSAEIDQVAGSGGSRTEDLILALYVRYN